MDRIEIKKKAQVLRSKGYTFEEIKKFTGINIPKSTLSYWCKDINLPESYYKKVDKLNRINRDKARKIAGTNREKERNHLIEKAKQEIQSSFHHINADKKLKKIILAVLYLGEGSKWKSHRGLMLGSADPNIIKLYIKLLKDVYSIPKNSLRARISYRADQDIKKLTGFWAKITGLEANHFYKTIPDSRTVGKPTKNKDYKGVCVISCAGTKIQLELEAITNILYKNI